LGWWWRRLRRRQRCRAGRYGRAACPWRRRAGHRGLRGRCCRRCRRSRGSSGGLAAVVVDLEAQVAAAFPRRESELSVRVIGVDAYGGVAPVRIDRVDRVATVVGEGNEDGVDPGALGRGSLCAGGVAPGGLEVVAGAGDLPARSLLDVGGLAFGKSADHAP